MRSSERRETCVSDLRMQRTVARRFVRNILLYFMLASLLGLVVQFLAHPLRGFSWYCTWFWTTNGPFLVALVLILPVFIRDTIRLTNRIVGPVCRLRSTIHSINVGEDPGTVQFRKNDFGHELAAEFNVLMERVRSAEQRFPDPEPVGTRKGEYLEAVTST